MNPVDATTPPHSSEAEQSVLGALLLDNAAWDRVGDVLRPEHFYHPAHRAIFATIGRLVVASKPADVITVHVEGGHDLPYLNDIAASVPSAASVRGYAEIVLERWRARQLMRIGADLADAALRGGPGVAPEQLIDRAVTALMALNGGSERDEPRDVGDLLPAFIDALEARAMGQTDAIPTGLVDMDRQLGGGLRAGELVVLGARPSMGKTAFVMTLCRNVAADHRVLMLTQEDSLQALVSRQVAAAGRINLADIRNPGKASDAFWGRVTDGVEAIGRLQLSMDEQAGLSLMDVRRKIQQTARRHGKPALVVIDYLQLMEGEGDNRNQSLGVISNGLKKAAKDFGTCIVLLSQLSRKADEVSGPPQMSHLRDSGDIEGAADIIWMLYREFMRKPTEENKHHAEVHFAKHKNGATGKVDLFFDGATQRFSNWDGPAPFKSAKRSSQGGRDLD